MTKEELWERAQKLHVLLEILDYNHWQGLGVDEEWRDTCKDETECARQSRRANAVYDALNATMDAYEDAPNQEEVK